MQKGGTPKRSVKPGVADIAEEDLPGPPVGFGGSRTDLTDHKGAAQEAGSDVIKAVDDVINIDDQSDVSDEDDEEEEEVANQITFPEWLLTISCPYEHFLFAVYSISCQIFTSSLQCRALICFPIVSHYCHTTVPELLLRTWFQKCLSVE